MRTKDMQLKKLNNNGVSNLFNQNLKMLNKLTFLSYN